MSDCPVCGYEYKKGQAFCPECGGNLLSSEPRFCDNCDGQIDLDADYCIHCGVIFEKEDPEPLAQCETHEDVPAVGVCVVCGRPVCSKCAKTKGGKVFCGDDEHVKIHQNWAVVYSSPMEYEAEMVKANLEIEGIKALVFSQVDHTYFIPMSRLAIVNVMVPKEELAKARDVLSRLRGIDDRDEFEPEGD